MKKITKYRVALLLCLSFAFTPLFGATIATGNGTDGTTTFDTAVCNTHTFDPETGTYYVGLTAHANANTYSITSFARPTGTAVPAGMPLVGKNANSTTNLADKLINYMDHGTMTQGGQGFLVFNTDTTPITLDVMRDDGTRYARSATLQDAGTGAGDCEKVLKVAADQLGNAYAQVKGAAADTWPDHANDAIATVTITDADPMTVALGTSVSVQSTDFDITGTGACTTNGDFIYTPHMGGRIYASSLVTLTANVSDKAWGIVILTAAADGTLAKVACCANEDSVVSDTASLTLPLAVESEGAAQAIYIRKMAVMKTSTGHHYLITNGGPAATAVAAANTRNEVYAHPLVSGHETAATNGTLAASADADLNTPDFSKQATAAGDIAAKTARHVTVGGGTLAIPANVATDYISDMQAVGDCVICSLQTNAVNAATNRGGLIYSQAQFNGVGKIIDWTDWAQWQPQDASGPSLVDGSAVGFAVDKADGHTWVSSGVAADAGAAIVRHNRFYTARADDTNSFHNQLRTVLLADEPCYCAVDLGAARRNWGDVSLSRCALFGTNGKVYAVRTSTVTSTALHIDIETSPSDFSAAGDVPVSVSLGLPAGLPVTALGWKSNNTGATDNYLFAGTTEGLYALCLTHATAANRTGFNVGTANTGATNVAPLDGTYTWYKITNIPADDIVLDIQSDNQAAYILTRTPANVDKVYQCAGDFAAFDTLDVAAAFEKIAESDAGDFAGIKRFNSIGLISNKIDGSENQLLIAHDKGIHMSTVAGGVQAAATTAALANFIRVSPDTASYSNLQFPDRCQNPHCFWAVRTDRTKLVPRDSLVQFGSNVDVDDAHTYPVVRQIGGNYNSNSLTMDRFVDFPRVSAGFFDVLPHGFYTDGALRFRIEDNNSSTAPFNSLKILPYDVSADTGAGGTNQSAEVDIMQSDLTGEGNAPHVFYWVKRIADRLMCGTDKGIVTLE